MTQRLKFILSIFTIAIIWTALSLSTTIALLKSDYIGLGMFAFFAMVAGNVVLMESTRQ